MGKEKKNVRFSAIITGASSGGSPELTMSRDSGQQALQCVHLHLKGTTMQQLLR